MEAVHASQQLNQETPPVDRQAYHGYAGRAAFTMVDNGAINDNVDGDEAPSVQDTGFCRVVRLGMFEVV